MQYACSKGLKLETLTCRLCASSGIEAKLAPLCAFQRIAGRQEELLVVHENCIAYTTIVDLGENNDSGIEKDYKNAFNVVDRAETCFSCGKPGATVCYTSPTCGMCYHVLCADSTGWKFDKHGSRFLCQNHRGGGSHFSKGEAIINTDDLAHRPSRCGSRGLEAAESSENDSDDYITENEETIEFSLPIAIPLAKCNSRRGILRLSRLVRETVRDRWNVDLYATGTARSASRKLKIASSAPDPHDQLEDGDVVQAINGIKIGSPDLDSLQKVFALLSQEVEAMLEVRRDNPASQWS